MLDDARGNFLAQIGVVEPEFGVVSRGGFRLAVHAVPVLAAAEDRHLHVGLAAAQPDFADQHVPEDDRGRTLFPGNCHGVGAAGFHFREDRLPFALRVGSCVGCDLLGGAGFRCDGDLYRLAGSGMAADPDRFLALQHHVITVNLVHGELPCHLFRQRTASPQQAGQRERKNGHPSGFSHKNSFLKIVRGISRQVYYNSEKRIMQSQNPLFHLIFPERTVKLRVGSYQP